MAGATFKVILKLKEWRYKLFEGKRVMKFYSVKAVLLTFLLFSVTCSYCFPDISKKQADSENDRQVSRMGYESEGISRAIDNLDVTVQKLHTRTRRKINTSIANSSASVGFTVVDRVDDATQSLGFTIVDEVEKMLSCCEELKSEIDTLGEDLRYTIVDKIAKHNTSILDAINMHLVDGTDLSPLRSSLCFTIVDRVDNAVQSLGFTIVDRVDNATQSLGFTICDKIDDAIASLGFTIVDRVDNATQSLGFTICDKVEDVIASLGFTIVDKADDVVASLGFTIVDQADDVVASLGFTVVDQVEGMLSCCEQVDSKVDEIDRKMTELDNIESKLDGPIPSHLDVIESKSIGCVTDVVHFPLPNKRLLPCQVTIAYQKT